jgi:hypothetical protein
MMRKKVEQVLRYIDKTLKKKNIPYRSIILFGGAAAYLAGATQRQPDNINVAICTHPARHDSVLLALKVKDLPMAKAHKIHRKIDIDGTEVRLEISSAWHHSTKAAHRHAEHICSLVDVPQHRVVYHWDGRLTGPEYYYYAPYWSKESMTQTKAGINTDTLRIAKFKRENYAMSDDIAMFALLGELGILVDLWVSEMHILTTYGFIEWDEITDFVLKVAMMHKGAQNEQENNS